VTSTSEIVQSALGSVTPSSTLDDLEKVASIVKTSAEANKSEIDALNAKSQLRQENLKAWSAILVPLFSLLALMFTVGIQALQLEASRQQQFQQLEASRQQDVDTQWRAFLDTVKNDTKESPTRIISDVTFPSRLKSFIHSKVYSADVVEVARKLLGNVVDQNGFGELLRIIYPVEEKIPLSDLVDISRELRITSDNSYANCAELSQGIQLPAIQRGNVCNFIYPGDQTDALITNLSDKQKAAKLTILRQNISVLTNEEVKISNLIANRARKMDNASNVDLSSGFILQTDFSGIDLTGSDISDSTFDRVDLFESKLKPSKYNNVQMFGSNWWEANEIDQNLLQTLVTYAWPGNFQGEIVVGHVQLTREYYVRRVNELCKPKLAVCGESELKFNKDNLTQVMK
jgi:hypothetical protein